jgi:outer membrane biosynthesis protein TonB
VPDAENLSKVAKTLMASKMWPNLDNEAKMFAVIEYGRELGIPPIASLNTMAVVNGRLTMEAKAMLAIANQRAGVVWKVIESTVKSCTIEFSRPNFQPLVVTFDEKDAAAAGLLGKSNWKTYPKAMFFARAASAGIRQIAPDAVLGLYATEEMSDTITVLPEKDEIKESPVEQPKELPKTAISPEPVKLPDEVKTQSAPAAEKKADPPKKVEPRPKAKPGPKPTPAVLPTEDISSPEIQDEIRDSLNTLVDKYGRDLGQLLEAIQSRLVSVFSTSRHRIPEDLTAKEAVVIRNALKNSIEKEEEIAAQAEANADPESEL